ncbi:uncharacterized protein LOC129764917 [Toxorhynchites rutilus septentrionalis]|uniref:uncharacterized protein LOC129764917 n=1 Tax=Toxorhynchites rutilus septentrionalis TaxID=329112 RepID=UPI002478F1B5|nr:uncharacterized protein LOC129764917 [Toxorhynchites rutilus septentrionalis]
MFTNWLAPPTTALPPDTIIEVGPPPFTRYAAHSALVSAHSGYLRAAVRSDNSTGSVETVPIYVPNVTAEQFTPLLTYMYTGFLDLNIENIFGVLLATHILHMPRALEMCRAFLSGTQTENYFMGLNTISATAGASNSHNQPKPISDLENRKVVRPIASKATGIGLNFIAPPASHILLPSTHTPFKSFSTIGTASVSKLSESKRNSPPPVTTSEITEKLKPVDDTNNESSETSKSIKDSNNQKRQSKSLKRCSNKSECILAAIAKNSPSNDKSVIIDIASCDGPVRFRRVLNDRYGMNNNTICLANESNSPSRYMSSSFHEQMVRNINEHKQNLSSAESYNCGSNKDENSQDNNQSQSSQQSGAPNTNSAGTTSAGETYSCVYCKHTFKSQYCYQKHAKRHLIPLSLEIGSNAAATTVDDTVASDGEKETVTKFGKSSSNGSGGGGGGGTKREVKPLDMNVQYYPCKTCGSKFPSYYFVHKHRKMCHADEDIL